MTDTVATGSLAGTERLDRQSLSLLFAGLFATAIGQAFVFAILPPLGRSVGLDEIRITAIISTSALIFTLVAPFWGRFSDTVLPTCSPHQPQKTKEGRAGARISER